VSRFLDVRWTLAALESAVANRRPAPGLIHHSDRGSQYAAKEYRDCLEALGMRGSMGRKGNPYGNAYAESFFKTIKHEEVYAYEYETMEDVIESCRTSSTRSTTGGGCIPPSGTFRPRSTNFNMPGKGFKTPRPTYLTAGVQLHGWSEFHPGKGLPL